MLVHTELQSTVIRMKRHKSNYKLIYICVYICSESTQKVKSIFIIAEFLNIKFRDIIYLAHLNIKFHNLLYGLANSS